MDIDSLMISSMTAQLGLDELVLRLQAQPEIDAILLAGTTGTAQHQAHSDYDLLLLLNEMDAPLSLLVTTIDIVLSELYFLKVSTVDEIVAHPETIEANSLHGAFLSMVVNGKIVYDASNRLNALRNVAPQTHYDAILSHQLYDAWYAITYNHAQNERYFHANDPLYLEALQCRLLYCISNCLSAYFTLRQLPWRGEKAAIRYLREHDPAYLGLFQTTVTAGAVERQYPSYVRLVEQTLPADMPLWPESFTVIQPQPKITPALIEAQLAQWARWVSGDADSVQAAH